MEKPAFVAAPAFVTPRPINSNVAPTAPNNTAKSTFKPPIFGAAPPPATSNSATKPEDVPTNYNSVAVNRSVTKVEKPTDFNATPATTASRAVTKVEKPANFNTATKTNARVIAVNNTATTDTKKASVTSITAGYFTIQVGNFAKKENADRISKTMKTQFDGKQKVFLLSGGSETLTTHRVMVGGFKTHKDATEFKKKNQINGFVQNYSSYIK